MIQDKDHFRYWAYFFVALAALLTGIILGQLGREASAGGSRGGWPHIVR